VGEGGEGRGFLDKEAVDERRQRVSAPSQGAGRGDGRAGGRGGGGAPGGPTGISPPRSRGRDATSRSYIRRRAAGTRSRGGAGEGSTRTN